MLASEQKSKAQGEKGKVAEADVRKYLDALSNRVAAFEYERIYDARSAGGKGIPARPGDFQYYRQYPVPRGMLQSAEHGLIEVKELEHAYRLPAVRLSSLPKLVKRSMSGGGIVILIKNPLTGMWRNPDLEFFRTRQGVPSWDLREFREYDTLGDALGDYKVFR